MATTVGAPAYAHDNEKSHELESGPQLVQIPHSQMLQVAAMPMTANPEYAFDSEAVKSSYQRYITIDIENPNVKIPSDLSSRNLSVQRFEEVITRVREIKKKSDTNKTILWSSMIFFFCLIGWLLVDRRSVGNKKLSHQLAPILEAFNQELGNSHVNVRFVWVQGTLRGYFR